MKKSDSDKNKNLKEIPPFDFENSMPNRFAGLYDKNSETVILNPEREYSVILEPDVAEYFSDSESVNAALRALISAMRAGRANIDACRAVLAKVPDNPPDDLDNIDE